MECLGNREVLCRRLVTFAMLERDTGALGLGLRLWALPNGYILRIHGSGLSWAKGSELRVQGPTPQTTSGSVEGLGFGVGAPQPLQLSRQHVHKGFRGLDVTCTMRVYDLIDAQPRQSSRGG